MTDKNSIPTSKTELSKFIQNIYERIQSAGIIQFDSDPYLSEWDLLDESDLDEDDEDQIVLECSYESEGNVFSTGITMGELKNCFIDGNVITFTNEKGDETKLALFQLKQHIINPDLNLEDKWKEYGLDSILSKYGTAVPVAELYDLLQSTEEADLETVFEENKIVIWGPYENNSLESVVANICDAAWKAQNIANS